MKFVLLFYAKVLVLIQLVNAQSSLRLVRGTWNGEGRVEIYHNGVWGTVCDDSWDINDARVVCRELGYSGAASAPQRAHFGAGSGQIWLDDVACQGSETSIVDCQHSGWGSHNCGHSEDASVICIQSCSTTLNSTFGEIDYNRTSNSYVRCQWSILSVGISPAVALVSVQELNFGNYYCSQYVKITDGDGTDVLYHRGCVPFATENLLDVQFGLSNNISVETYLGSAQSSVKIKFAVLKNGISSASLVSGWNVTVLNSGSTGFTIQWTKLHSNINRVAAFYVILIKSTEETILSVEVVQGTATTVDVRGLKPSSKYRVSVYGVDATGQPYKSLESLTSTTDVFCGVRPSASRIVGGSVAKVNSWPWQAMLTNSYGSHFCGGSLVDHEWVVTAAHCVSGKSPSSIKIKLGTHYRTSGSVGTEQEVGVAKIIMHENYNNPLTKSNDIALIKLITPADLGVGIGLVCMPDNSHALPFDNVYRKCWITGWGTLSYGGYHPNALMEAQVPLVSKQRCEGAYPGKIDDTMLCAGLDEGGVDTCQGDSGGPLVCEFNGTWYLEGATSWGSGCAYARKYGVYAYVRNLKVWISRHIYQVVPPTVFPQNQSVSALVWCYFDNGICSGWNQSSSDDFDWTLASGSTPSSSTGPTSGQGGSGKFMYIETSSPRKPGEKAKLVVTVPNNGKKLCLSFYYHMFGATVGTLNVYSGNIKVFNISGNQGNTWMRVEITIYHRSVIFEGITGYSFTSDIAIDSVEITKGSCPVSCNFDNGLCYGWSQLKSDVFDWTLYSGSTPSWNTGPSSDHSGSGKYLYIEASSWSTGDNAKLELAVPRNKSSCCLTFYYHMYGANMGTLNVFSGNNKIFTKSGNQGNYWKKVTRTVYMYLSDIVTFEGIRGSSYRSDIAIDDVSIVDGNCPGCGGFLNKTSGVLLKENAGDEGELHCNWKIGNAGISYAVAIVTLQRIYLRYCSEYVKLLRADGSEVFNQQGCNSSYPAGTALEVPYGAANQLILDVFLEYRWSAVNIKYSILNQGLDSAQAVSSWNITVNSITSSSARVYWPNLPLSPSVSYYLVRYKEVSNGVGRLFEVSRFSNSYYTNLLYGYTAYDVQVFAVTSSGGNATYASNTVSIITAEGAPSRAPTNVRVKNYGLNELLVKWNSVPPQYANGRLLGYNVYYKRTQYYYYSDSIVSINNTNTPSAILPNIQIGERYQISVAAFTSTGLGPRSPLIYITKGCEGSVNQSFGWLNFTHSNYNSLNCTMQIYNAGLNQGVALISFQNIYFWYCSEFIKIYDSDGDEVFRRRGCDSYSRGLSVEIPFSDGDSITLEVFHSSRYSYARIQYTLLDKELDTAQVLPSWNTSITSTTSSSLTVRWSTFPLSVPILRFLVKYTEQNSNFSMVYQVASWYNTHYSGSVLKGYQFYEVKIIAVATSSGNGTYSSIATLIRTKEGVPSIAPTNVRVSKLQFSELKVQWDPIPEHSANGRLQGYRVYFQEYSYWYGYVVNTANTSDPYVNMVVLRGLKAGQRYRIWVLAFTSAGVGPQSSSYYVITDCGGYANRSFGQLQIGSNRHSSYLSCTLVIGRVGISQAVAGIWIQDLYLPSYSEYIKISDGNGLLVWYKYGYSSSAWKSFLEVGFGNADNITVQIYIRSSSSRFKLQYGILKQGIQSALSREDWNVTAGNTSTTTMAVNWQNLSPLINDRVLYYIALISGTNGSLLNTVVVSGNESFANFLGLSSYTEYQVSVIGVKSDGQPYKSSNVTARTDEGVPSRAPSNIRLSSTQFDEVKVQWDPLPQQYANGRLLGYTVHYYEYYNSYLRKAVHTNSPYVNIVTLRGLKAATRYSIAVAAFTSKGAGTQSYRQYITTGCGGNLNRLFGNLQVGRRYSYYSYSSLRCTWTVGKAGISQAVALVSLPELYLSYSSEYLKVIDGNGFIALSRYGYSSVTQKTFKEVSFGSSGNINVQIYLYRRYSTFKLQFGILMGGFQSALPVANWSAYIDNTTTTSIRFSWQNLSPLLVQISHYYVVLKTSYGSSLNGNIMSGNTTSHVFSGLSAYTEYRLSVVGVGDNGTAYKSTEVTVRTDEGVPSSAPYGIRVTSVPFSSNILVYWNPLSQSYANGKILGYTVYYGHKQGSYYWSLAKSVNTSGANTTQSTLTNLKAGLQYRVAVAAFTSKGVGRMSYWFYATTGCASTLNSTFGEIDYNLTSSYYVRCQWSILSAGISQAVALVSVQELSFAYSYCSQYAKITDGNGTDVLYHRGCVPFAAENLLDIQFGLSRNISVETYLGSAQSSVKIKFAIIKNGISSAVPVSGWNVTVLKSDSTGFTIQWTKLRANINRVATFYVILIKRSEDIILAVEIVPGTATTLDIGGLKPSSKYRVSVYGVDDTGQPHKSLESLASTTEVFCGFRPSASRIVGGFAATVNSWPWQAMLTYSSGSQFCGGSLVNREWVVTAAHCVSGKYPSSIKIKLGAHYRTSGSVGTEQEIGVSKIIMHENYNRPLSNSNDIALIKLIKPANLGVGVGLVCMPDISHALPFDNINRKCWITGWGTLYSGGYQPNTLMEAQIPLVSKQRCQSSYPGQIDDTMLCAGLDAGGVDTCQGDSGGPLVCEFNGTWYLEGVTSWGYRCAYARKYGVYAYVRNLKAWVSRHIYQVVPPTAFPQNQSVSALVWCYFNNGICSGWNQSSSDDFDWTLASGSTPSSSTGPTSGQGGSGNFVYIETSSPRKPGEKAKLVVSVPSNGIKACLTFYCHMYGATAGTLNVYSGNNKVFNISGNQGNNWMKVEISIYLNTSVIFEGIRGDSFTGDIAIDSVEITKGSCPVVCNFDNGLCYGWSQSKSDVFDWTLYYGSTPSSYTGPSSDHSGSGKYLYIEASSWSTGDNAKLELAVSGNKSPCCLTFYYHMYGANMGTLNVFSGNNKVFTKSGNQGNYWKKVTRTVYLSNIVIFEGIRGSSYRSDIAIDDVSIVDGGCPGCGGFLNKTSGVVLKENDRDEGEMHCNWTIGNVGISHAVAIVTLQRIYLRYCSEYVKLLKPDGSEVFNQQGCNSSYPAGTALEVPYGATDNIILDVFIEYRWSAVNIKYKILNHGLDSAQAVSSWNITVYSITSSSARVYWPNLPLPQSVSNYLVRYKEVSNGVGRLFEVNRFSNWYYTRRLKGYTAYDVQVFAVTSSGGNVTYASNTVSIITAEGVPSRAPTNARVANYGLNELLVKWDPIPPQYANGRLLGYNVYYKRTQYYYYSDSIVSINNTNSQSAILPNIQTGERYQISVAAFTSAGLGPRSPLIYITKGCEGSVNQSFGWLNFTHSNYNNLNCTMQIYNAGLNQGVARISFQYIYLRYCSEFIKIYDSNGGDVFRRRGCDSFSSGLYVEIPFGDGSSITLEVLLSYRYSYARIRYTVLDKALDTAQVVPSWNTSITSRTSSSLTVRWSTFPLSVPILRFLVKYTQLTSNVSMIYQLSSWYNTHYSGRVLKGYQFYEVKVIAVATSSANGTYSSTATLVRTKEGVPSIPPSNVRVSKLQLSELKVQWDPIPEHSANGRLQGYRVYFQEYSYWYGYVVKTADTSGPYVNMVVLRGLKAGQRYRIWVLAFTSAGVGPQSSSYYIITDCGGYANRSFGQLQISSNRYSSYLSCTLVIGRVGISQAVAGVWIQDLYLPYYGEYIKITDGNGSLVWYKYGYTSSASKSFLEVGFGNADNITVQINIRSSSSRFKLRYGILKKGIQSALPVADWNITVGNTSATTIAVYWQHLAPYINDRVLYYIVLISGNNGSQFNTVVVSANESFANVLGLSAYTEYQVSVIGVKIDGQPYKSSNVTAMTDEGVPSRAPSNLRLSNVQFDEVRVQWVALPQQYANGRLLGYTVYYYEYYNSYQRKALNTSSPYVNMVTLRGLKAATRYYVAVAAFTSKGAGPQSSWLYTTTGCGGNFNRLFGNLQVGRRYYYYSYNSLRCTWTVGNAGVGQAVALVSLPELYLPYYTEYIRVIDGNGFIALSRYGYSSAPQKTFKEVSFGNSGNITVQIHLYRTYSTFRLQFGILMGGFQSALPLANWSTFIDNTTTTSIQFSWQNLSPLLGQQISHYFVVLKNGNGSSLNGNIMSGNTTSYVLSGLSGYTEYRLSVVGVDVNGTAYNSTEVTIRTDEGVPSRAPSNIRLSNLQPTEVKVQWDPLPQQYANGRLLGYTVYYYEYYNSYQREAVNASSPYVNMVTLRDLKSATRYYVAVAAFTSKGAGRQSYWQYITTVCGGSWNQSFGLLQVGRRYSSYVQCTWTVGDAGVSQAVALVSLQELYLSYYYEYLKIINGNGVVVLSRYGYSSAPQKTFLQVSFGNSASITVQIYLTRRYSNFKLQFGILQQGFQSALPVTNWSASSDNETTTSIKVSWQNLASLLHQRILHYIVVVKSTNGSILNGNIVPGTATSDVFYGLMPYTEYRLSVLGVDDMKRAYKSAEGTAWTEEGVPSRAPNNITFKDVKETRVTVSWNPLPRQFHNGRVLGYKVYLRKNAYYSVQSNTSSVNVSNPNTTQITLTGLQPAQRYDVSVSAFTSKGEGPRSYNYYFTTACRMIVNQSAGLIDLTHAGYSSIYCYWTIGNTGMAQAIGLFLIEEINFGYCSEYFKIFDGNEVLKYYHNGCSSSVRGSLVEVPFLGSSNITASIYLRQLKSNVRVRYLILTKSFNTAPLLSGWIVVVKNTTFSSILIQWTNLTNLLNRQVGHYITLVNRTNSSALVHQITPGDRLTTEIDGLVHSSNYTVEVVGVDRLGKPYKTPVVYTRTKNITCGVRPRNSSARIVGGTVAPVNSWPWQAMLLSSSGRQFCGGSLIYPEWVLTATHCVRGKSLSDVKVRMGAHYRLSSSIGTEQDFDVIQIILHENYHSPNTYSNDIALLRLSKPAKLGKGVGLVCLSDPNFQLPFDNSDKPCWITGWGRLYYFGPQPNPLMQVGLPLVSKQRCMNYYPGKIDDSMICIGKAQGGQGACHGDSGGPLVCEFNGKWYLEGVTSWSGMPCASPSKPTVYANVRNLKQWIINKISNQPTSSPPTTAPSSSGLRLVGGNWNGEGRVEIRHNGVWGTVCDDFWDLNDAQVVCRELGYPGAVSAPSNARFGAGSGRIWLDDVRCQGNEKSIANCQHRGWGVHNCDHSEDASVICSSVSTTYAPWTTSYPTPWTPPSAQAACNFDYGLCSGWRQSYSDVFDWTRYSGSTPSSGTGPSSDHTSGSGYYMYIEASSPRSKGDNAKLLLSVSGSKAPACLEFYYHMYGDNMGALTVFSGNAVVLNVSGNQGYTWKKASRTIYLSYTITFEGTVGSNFKSDVAIDDVSITSGRCSAPPLASCNFDTGLCSGWYQFSYSDVFDWTRHTGATPSYDTGPSSDHTSGSGYYMYIETSSPRQKGDNAKLQLSVPGSGAQACLSFYYHMYGDTMGTLTIFSGNVAVFNASGDQGNFWRKATRTIYLQNTVTFEGIAGSSFTGDIAIDDITITSESCLGSTAYPTTQNTSTFTPWSSSPSPESQNTTPFAPTSSSPSPGDCFDLDGLFCLSFAYGSFCINSFNLTRKYCAKTCGFCGAGCSDNLLACPDLSQDFCNSNFNWSVHYCRRSCGFCTDILPTAQPSIGPHPQTGQPNTAASNSNEPTTGPDPQTPSAEEKKESVMLKIEGMDIDKWNKTMEDSFKRKVASAATKYCSKDETQCHVPPTSSRRRRSFENMTFTYDMVHILPGYPKQASNEANIILLAFYLHLPHGFSENSIVTKDVLKDIVMDGSSNIGKSVGGDILSVDPLPSTSEQLEEGNGDKGSDEQSKPTNVIIGASVGGILVLVIIAAALVGCKKSNRFGQNRRVENRGSLDRRNASKHVVNTSTGENADHIDSVEQAVEIEEIDEEVIATPSPGERYDKQPEGSASDKVPSKSRPIDSPIQSASHLNQGFRESQELNSFNQEKGSNSSTKNARETKRIEVERDSTDLSVNQPEVSQEVRQENIATKSSPDLPVSPPEEPQEVKQEIIAAKSSPVSNYDQQESQSKAEYSVSHLPKEAAQENTNC